MHDVHAGTLALRALRTTVNLATTRDKRHRLRNSTLCDTTATVVHANINEAVGISLQGTLLERKECPLVLEAHHGTRMASKRRQQQCARMPGMHRWTASKATPRLFRNRDHAGQYRCRGNVIMTEGNNEAVQPGRFSLKEVESDSNGSDLTTKHHDRKRRIVLIMTLAKPRYTRVRGNAVSTASKRKSAAVVIAMVSTTWLKPRCERPNLGDPGGFEIAELGRRSLGREGPRTACLNCTRRAPVW